MCIRDSSIFAGVGERTREGNDLYNEMIESGVINLEKPEESKVASVDVYKRQEHTRSVLVVSADRQRWK